jgi:hypothetical protein
MDRVGFEPTTSAALFKGSSFYLSKEAELWKENLTIQVPAAPLFPFACSIAHSHLARLHHHHHYYCSHPILPMMDLIDTINTPAKTAR